MLAGVVMASWLPSSSEGAAPWGPGPAVLPGDGERAGHVGAHLVGVHPRYAGVDSQNWHQPV